MVDFIYGLPTFTMALMVVGGLIILSIAGLAVARYFIPPAYVAPHHDVAGYTYAAVGVVYAVLLAFVAISVWDTFGRAENLVRDEASSLGRLYRDAGFLPPATASVIRAKLIAYTKVNIEKEWPAMSAGRLSTISDTAFEELSSSIAAIDTTAPKDQIVFQQLFTEFNDLVGKRDTRRFLANKGLHPIVWCVLAFGAFIFITFTYFFGIPDFYLQSAMTDGVAATIGIVFVLIIAMDYPFRGEFCVSSVDFRELLRFWGQIPNT
jgi:hypothetical protein